jgi:tetratricopeptide (TPR) repeat protein
MTEQRENFSDSGPGGWMALGAASREKADAFLEEQTVLARLQADDLRREDRVRHWSLRVRHISDVMKLIFELTLAAFAVVVIAALASAIWSAAHDDSVVIDAFRVPADMAQRGMSGDVVASQLLDRLAQLQAQTDSSRAPGTYASNWGSEIRVEIPNTGVSIGEAYRYLAGWLGHQTHISGEIWRTEKGIALTVRTSSNSSLEFAGRERDLGALLERAAESVYGQTQPYRYAIYLTSHGRNAEEEKILRDLALNGPASEKPWAYSVWAYSALNADNMPEALRRSDKAVELEPDLPLAQNDLAFFEANDGHDEQELQASRAARRALDGNGAHLIISRAATVTGIESDANIAEELGDFREAVAQYEKLAGTADFEGSQWLSRRMGAADASIDHDVAGSRRLLGTGRDANLVASSITGFGWQLPNFSFAQFEQFVAVDDWKAARADIEAALATPAATTPGGRAFLRAQAWPWLALAEAESGDMNAARREIAKTPLDCYLCLRVRGQIDSLHKNWNGAAYWFARAVTQAPSPPFAYTDWGQTLLHKGDCDGAIAKFRDANVKGPHFADPLEMWGEALMLKNRSDLALAKFEEANKYAPNWGRLHLKWGEALYYTGQRAQAEKQFSATARLELSHDDAIALRRWRGAPT